MTDSRFIELSARDRAKGLLDAGTYRELLGPFEYIMSPWLEPQNIVPAADDGMIVAKGTIGGKPSVVIAIEGTFQGGSMGEVSGAKMAAALELAAEDNRNGIPTQAVLLLETGGVRLQEANLGWPRLPTFMRPSSICAVTFPSLALLPERSVVSAACRLQQPCAAI